MFRKFYERATSVAFASLGGLLVAAKSAHAISVLNPQSGLGLESANLIDTVIAIVSWVLGLLALIAVIMIIIAGFQWMTAGGNDDQVGDAKKRIYAAGIGLVIVLLAWAIVLLAVDTLAETTNTESPL